MWRWAIVAVSFAGGCANDPCADGRSCELTVPSQNGQYAFRLVSDDAGWVVVFVAADGLHAARPGVTAPADVPASGSDDLAVARTDGGLLACAGAACGVLDRDLRWIVPLSAVPYGSVWELPRLGGALYAISYGPQGVGLTPIADDGSPRGATVPIACTGGHDRIAWRGDELACLVPSDPTCWQDIGAPPDCRTMLERFDATGAAIDAPLEVAPFGNTSELLDVGLAARDDGYLVVWQDQTLHARAITPDGAIAATSAVTGPASWWTSVGATADGYAVVTSTSEPLAVVTFAADATPTAAPTGLGDDAALPSGWPDTASFATSDRRSAVAWGAENLVPGAGYRAAILFREL